MHVNVIVRHSRSRFDGRRPDCMLHVLPPRVAFAAANSAPFATALASIPMTSSILTFAVAPAVAIISWTKPAVTTAATLAALPLASASAISDIVPLLATLALSVFPTRRLWMMAPVSGIAGSCADIRAGQSETTWLRVCRRTGLGHRIRHGRDRYCSAVGEVGLIVIQCRRAEFLDDRRSRMRPGNGRAAGDVGSSGEVDKL